jgi:hypothetical protein
MDKDPIKLIDPDDLDPATSDGRRELSRRALVGLLKAMESVGHPGLDDCLRHLMLLGN